MFLFTLSELFWPQQEAIFSEEASDRFCDTLFKVFQVLELCEMSHRCMLHYCMRALIKGGFTALYVARTPEKQTKEEPRVTLTVPHHVHGNIRLEYDRLVFLTD